ncbi:hypothetical protein E1A91_A13G151300v1 [Gossypium mustelinum]|uniref:Uncharacterized protein n=1 Tax=Gossypium mustelinum TaxID=34275 RepID=A0A5D2WIB5_GOSMU|nr:hypothetical protein E1A91_A13G151300v1 [Gossypium mustelinum]
MTKGSTSFTFSEKSASLTGEITSQWPTAMKDLESERPPGDSVAMEGVDVAEACNIQVDC